MIKGKKIGDVNVKVAAPQKGTQKDVGIAVGKLFLP